ncbi:KamA family radical SAM protein [Desulfococcus sp.]|uniref:KamA family radical SAM protein n=1 Tax=Desulfococcus sp. TaxID=2025834 RepID=UPI0035943A5F
MENNRYRVETLTAEAAPLLELIEGLRGLGNVRRRLFNKVSTIQFETFSESNKVPFDERLIVRDCARAFRGMLKEKSDRKSGFSVAQALWDIARGIPRPELTRGFYAELIHMVRGIQGRAGVLSPADIGMKEKLKGRKAALARSDELDHLWAKVSSVMDRYEDGLSEEALARRSRRREAIEGALGATPGDWDNWLWQAGHVVTTADLLSRLVRLTEEEHRAVTRARELNLPFGITPYYLSLMDDNHASGRDRAVRAQVLPPESYVEEMGAARGDRSRSFDFMLERETSPVDLVTRRYPAIAILKPFNTCPQICVYCQRNWEIDEAMAPTAMARPKTLEKAFSFIEEHPAIREILVTGGDPLILSDNMLHGILSRLAAIKSIDMIRIGSRTPVTLPMRITRELGNLLGSFRKPGQREVCLTTHVEHPYEITPEFVAAVDRLKRQGISVYNQHVYTFFVSRRFEAASLRLLLRRCGVEPYYTFVPKGKEETSAYRVPLARILQEQKEEARLLPGTRRTDEAVYNVPGLGKNYVRAYQNRDLISVLPDGSRVYEYHPWEKMIARRKPFVGVDVPILKYLERLADIGEKIADYESIWYYY